MFESQDRILTVGELSRDIKSLLEEAFPLVRVVGEVSNVSRPQSGHLYLTLKDPQAQIAVVAWRNVAQRIRFDLKDGLEIVVTGRITVYEPRGNYQIVASLLEPKGIGALQLAFLQMKEKLEKEGLFDPARKKPIPFLPSFIGMVTSPSGAAVRDMLKVINQRFPRVCVLLAPVRVQGEGAAEEIARAIDDFNRMAQPPDVLIVGRGGGSIEDLWAFNEEAVARAIGRSQIPIISAVGHEMDVTISDFVADRRALTPTEAGQMVVPRMEDVLDTLNRHENSLKRSLRTRLDLARSRLESLGTRTVLSRPLDLIFRPKQRLDELAARSAAAAANIVKNNRERVGAFGRHLESLNPRSVLARGYSITTDASGKVVRSVQSVEAGDALRTLVADGTIESAVVRAGGAEE